MIKYCVGYQIRNYKSKKDGSARTMGVLYCLIDDDRIIGKGVEEILVFSSNVIDSLNKSIINNNIQIDYRINGTSAYVNSISVVK